MLAKRFIAMLLSVAMTVMLAGCGNAPASNAGDSAGGASETSEASETSDASDAGDTSAQTGDDASVPQFATLDDPDLLMYMQDSIYADLESQLGEDYNIENVTAAYVPFVSDEYKQELAYNSQENIYFGYTLSELDQQFQGTRYIFTADDQGNTTVKEFQSYDDTYDQAIKNVAEGTGFILICVTASAVSGGVGAAPVCAVFATAANGGTAVALSSGAISAAAAGAVKAYETGGNMDAVAKEAALKGSEAFKWGAIMGALAGGVSEASALRDASKAAEAAKDGAATVVTFVRTPRESELAALKMFGGKEQVSYLNGQEVAYGTKGATRPDIVRDVAGKLEAIEVKNYDLANSNNLNELYNELKREVSARLKNLPEGSIQRVVLDVKGRGYDQSVIDAAKQGIWSKLADIYPDIPIDIME